MPENIESQTKKRKVKRGKGLVLYFSSHLQNQLALSVSRVRTGVLEKVMSLNPSFSFDERSIFLSKEKLLDDVLTDYIATEIWKEIEQRKIEEICELVFGNSPFGEIK